MIAIAFAKDMAEAVDGLTYDDTGTTGNVFVQWMPSSPDFAVSVMAGPGDPQMTKAATDLPNVQVLVRSDRVNPRLAFEVARAIYDWADCRDLVTFDDGGDDEVFVIGCTADQSSPVPIGRDSNDRHEWSINFSLRTHAPTVNRP